MATLYELLDVDPAASAAEVRAAYLVKARALHPDRHGGETAAEMAVAQRRMQEVNAAWTVLSDPRGRREYDESLRSRANLTGPVVTGAERGAHPAPVPWERVELAPSAPASAIVQLIRIGPVMLLLALLGAIFVFTAFAIGGSSVDIPPFPGDDDDLPSTGDCIEVGADIEVVSCDGPNSGRITAVEVGADAESRCAARGDVPMRVVDTAVICVRPAA